MGVGVGRSFEGIHMLALRVRCSTAFQAFPKRARQHDGSSSDVTKMGVPRRRLAIHRQQAKDRIKQSHTSRNR
eukprot:scaffold300131_cov40-Tisochrysis_lutea.AAC.1